MKMHHDIIQGTEEWHYLRMGRVGSSEAACLLVNGKSKSGLGTGAISLLFQKASEIITGDFKTGYVSEEMQRGSEMEPMARRRYEEGIFIKVKEVGYISEGEYLGFSPDGLVGDAGIIEIKCPSGPEFIRYSVTGKIDPKYIAQVQWGLWITKREWCDFVVYHPDFKENCNVVRIEPDPEIQNKFDSVSKVFVDKLEKTLEKMGHAILI